MNVGFLKSTKKNGQIELVDRDGQRFKPIINDGTRGTQVCETVVNNPLKCVRVIRLENGSYAYGAALTCKLPGGELSRIDKEKFPELFGNKISDINTNTPVQNSFQERLNDLVKAKPTRLKLSNLKWKYAVRCALKGKNIMMVGEKGSGKTLTAYSLSRVLPDHPFYVFNLGATQDPRGELIGNTHFEKGEGTIFKQSEFVRAITTPGAIILLDELSRAHPDAWNILMSVLDQDQRYLRLSEDPETPKISVAPGVSFVATANKGVKYTSTRVIDAALEDRFTFIEFDMMGKDEMNSLLMELFPQGQKENAKAIAGIYDTIRKQVETDNGKVENYLSPRQCIEGMDLLESGFTLDEVAETAIYPFFDKDGGTDSERAFVAQTVQKYVIEPEIIPEADTAKDWFDLSEEKPF